MYEVLKKEIACLAEDEEIDVFWHSRSVKGRGAFSECMATHCCEGEMS